MIEVKIRWSDFGWDLWRKGTDERMWGKLSSTTVIRRSIGMSENCLRRIRDEGAGCRTETYLAGCMWLGKDLDYYIEDTEKGNGNGKA